MSSPSFWPVALGSAAGIAALAYALWIQSSAGRLTLAREIKVQVAAARKISTPGVVQAAGELTTAKQTNVLSPLPGVVKELRVKVGDRVNSGDTVAVVQAKELLERAEANEIARKAAVASLNESKTRLEKAGEKLDRTRDLYRKDLIARREVEEMETVAETARLENERAQAELAQREAALAQTRYLLGLTRIVAPSSGIVTRRFVQPGASLAASAVIISVGDPAVMRATVTVDGNEAQLMRAGMVAQVRVPVLPGKIFRGTVSDIKMAAEEGGARAQIDVAGADGLLRPGMEASVSVDLGRPRELIVVPRAAVFESAGKPCVYVVEGGRARQREVATAGEIADETVIASDLAEGEQVIVAAGDNLQSGSYVRIMNLSHRKRPN